MTKGDLGWRDQMTPLKILARFDRSDFFLRFKRGRCFMDAALER